MDNSTYKLSNLNIMVVDDHAPMRKAIKRILVSMGAKNIHECSDGTDAIKLLKSPIDLIICDIYMNRIDGFEVLTHLRNRPVASDIPFIMISGDDTKEIIVKAMDLGANDYVMKPFQAEAIQSKVTQVLTNFYSPTPLLKALRFGDKLVLEQNFDKAIKAYQYAQSIDPSSQRARMAMAMAMNLRGETDNAIELLQKNISENPSYFRNYTTLADILLKHDRGREAVDAMLKELTLNPKQTQRQVQLAELLMNQGDVTRAIEHYKNALKENSKNKDGILGLAKCYTKIPDIEKVLYYFKKLRRQHPQDMQSSEEIIKWAIQAQAEKKIEALLKDERVQFAARPENHVQLGRFYILTNRLEEAQKVIQDLCKLDKDNLDGLKLQAALAFKTKEYDKSAKLYSQVITRDPNAQSFVEYGESLQYIQQIKDSILVLHKALELAPTHPMAIFLLAQAFRLSRQYQKAFYMYQVAKARGSHTELCNKNIALCKNEIILRRKNG